MDEVVRSQPLRLAGRAHAQRFESAADLGLGQRPLVAQETKSAVLRSQIAAPPELSPACGMFWLRA
jgi:hypothetical protein